MKWKLRTLATVILRAARTFPAVVVTGPRQSGKTTLLRMLPGPRRNLVSLEDPDLRMRARRDPRAFLADLKLPVMLDEIQYAPELLPYIKTRIDSDRKPGQWFLTGSQNFVLMRDVSQSLAGRAAVVSLLPFSFAERTGNGKAAVGIDKWLRRAGSPGSPVPRVPLDQVLLRGSYPEIASRKAVDRQLWCGSYLTTYLERDIRNLAAVGDLSQYETFLKACAARTGQILSLSELARDVGLSVPTVKRWISMLETGYQILLLRPYYRNLGKRLIKAPKLYFGDTGLASYLLGLHDRPALQNGPSFGSLFETFVVTDLWKRFLHSGRMPSMYFLRTRDGLEVDLVIEEGDRLHLVEIKSAQTITPKHADALVRLREELGDRVASTRLISCSPTSFRLQDSILNLSWHDALAG